MPLQLDQLVADLLARGDMNDDTVIELNRILEDWRQDRLDPDDAAYIEGLHAKVLNTSAEPFDTIDDDRRIEGLTIEEWRDRALRAEASLARIEDAASRV